MKQMKEKQNLKQDSNVFKKIPEWLLYVFISVFSTFSLSFLPSFCSPSPNNLLYKIMLLRRNSLLLLKCGL